MQIECYVSDCTTMHAQDGVSEAQQAVDREQAALNVSAAALKAHDGAVTEVERRLMEQVICSPTRPL